MVFSLLFAGALLIAAPLSVAQEAVNLENLLDEMTDLSNLARFPHPPFVTKQASSYDRNSKSQDDAEGWFANADSGKFLRVDNKDEGDEYVLMDADGPGAVVRIWSANPKGSLRLYLDGNETPAMEKKMAEVLDGSHFPFIAPLAGIHAMGWNCYFPIPFSKHCKITSTEGGFYYHVNYRVYPEDTVVESFSLAKAESLEEKIEVLAAILSKPYEKAPLPEDVKEVMKEDETLRGKRTLNLSVPGEGAIYRILATLTADNVDECLRSCLLEGYFDGESEPSIQCPLGDFFGTAPGLNPFTSLPCGMLEDGTMYSNWVMPFRKGARLSITNHGDKPVGIRLRLFTGPFERDEHTLRFHAKWRMETDISTRPFMDWNYLECTGKGVFAGVALDFANPVKSWWGEGDEKIYVDGEKFPSHFGTGTEDYFGYAWASAALFQHAYHNQPRCDGPRNYGHASVNRFHIIDRIPYSSSFRFDMELWHWADTKIAQAVTAYWYAVPGNKDSFRPLHGKSLTIAHIAPYVAPRLPGALEGEEMVVMQKPEHSEVQNRSLSECSNEAHLWWTGAKKGDEVKLGFPVEKPGKYEVSAILTTGEDYGICELDINEQTAEDPLDLYRKGAKKTGKISLGNFNLRRGQASLTVRIIGKNQEAAPGRVFGLDCIFLEKVK